MSYEAIDIQNKFLVLLSGVADPTEGTVGMRAQGNVAWRWTLPSLMWLSLVLVEIEKFLQDSVEALEGELFPRRASRAIVFNVNRWLVVAYNSSSPSAST